MKTPLLTILFIGGFALSGMGQAPVITDVSPLNTYPTGTILITGDGFSNSKEQLQVWFGHVKGSIVSSTTNRIEVLVPPQAQLTNVEVINLSTGLSVKSHKKLKPYFSGDTFDPNFVRFNISGTTRFQDLCSCDLNDDAKPDIVVTKNTSPEIVIARNQSTPGSLSFTSSAISLAGNNTEHPSCGDLDGDGKPDIVVSKAPPAPRNSIHILKNNSAKGGAIVTAPSYDLYMDEGVFASRTFIRDLNGDGKPEVIVTNTASHKNLYIFINRWTTPGVLDFDPTPIKLTIPNNETYGIEVQDMNGDRLPDIIVTQFQKSNMLIFRNQSASGAIRFADAQVITVSGQLNKIATADFDNDGLLDLAVTAYAPANQCHILLNKSSAETFSFPVYKTIPTDPGAWGIDVGDFNGDSFPDIAVGCISTNKLNVFLHNANSNAPDFTKIQVPTTLYSINVVAGDFDGDGKPDLAFTSLTGTAYSLDIIRNKTCFKPKILNEGTLCAGVKLQSVPGLGVSSYTWLKDGSVFQATAVPYLETTVKGAYSVKATSEGGACVAESNKIDVLEGPTPAATITAEPAGPVYCAGGSLKLSGPVGSYRYEWTKPDGTTSSDASLTISGITPQHAGTYKLRVAAGSCVSDYNSKTIEVVSLSDFTISSPSSFICQENGSVTLSVDAGYVYQWKKNGIDIAGATNNTYTATASGAYSVNVGSNACEGSGKETAPVNITAVTSPVAAFQIGETRCANTDISFTSTSTLDAKATAKYFWTWGDNLSSSESNPSTTHKYTTAKDYTVSLEVSYAGVTGCTNKTSQTFTVSNSVVPVVSMDPALICPGENAAVSVSGSFTSISWSSGGSGSSTTLNQPGDYTVTTTDAFGCRVTKAFSLQSKVVPEITVMADKGVDKPIAAGESVHLAADGAHDYSWEPAGSLDNASLRDPIATPLATTTYTVTGTLNGECSAQAQITIQVNESACTINPPLAFSPNGDDKNPVWYIEEINNFPEQYSDCTMNIFDGRGRRVYQEKGYTKAWDGTYQGKPAPSGTYYYVFGCPDKKMTCSGSVLVFR